MKPYTFFIFLNLLSFLHAQKLRCIVPSNMLSTMEEMFKPSQTTKETQVILSAYPKDSDIFISLMHVEFAIVRADILFDYQETYYKTSQYTNQTYMALTALPYNAQLFLIQDNYTNPLTLASLKDKTISIGNFKKHNNLLIKALLTPHKLTYNVHLKSIPYADSLMSLKRHKIDAFFGFLPEFFENDNFNFQKGFTKETPDYLKQQKVYKINDTGIQVPYILIANQQNSQEEIKAMIYLFLKQGLFDPITQSLYGPINQEVKRHIAEIQANLKTPIRTITQEVKRQRKDPDCKAYHYGFLNLLRQKPALKKSFRRHPSKRAKRYLYGIESILKSIDAEKSKCNLDTLLKYKKKFQKFSSKLKQT